MERSRPSTTVRRDDPGEFRVGRLKHERVKVPRGEAMMEWAESVMQLHADRKSVLEVSRRGFSFSFARRTSETETYGFCFQVEFQGEEGTGLGPTLEFYALIAAEFQRTSLGIWLCDDDFPDDESRQVRRWNRPSRVSVCSTSETTRANRLPGSENPADAVPSLFRWTWAAG